MNYQKHYDALCTLRQAMRRKKGEGEYYESHHIIPKSMGGSNDSDNLVLLTAREHYIAHWMLYRIHRSREMAAAFFCITFQNDHHERMFSSRKHAIARESMSKVPYPKGWSHTEETKAKLREHGKKHVGDKNNRWGIPHTEESRRKIGDAQIGELNHMHGKTGEQHHNYGKKLPQISISLWDKKPEVWKLAREAYDVWEEDTSKGSRFVGTRLDLDNKVRLDNLIKKFRNGWNPRTCKIYEAWLSKQD